MLISNLILGISFIAVSIVVLVFPNTIAGYNTLTKEEKEKIKKKELARFLFIVLFSVGIIIIIGAYIFVWLQVPFLNYILHPILYILMLIILFSNNKKFYRQD